jgi:hypothetical protein
MAKTKPKDVPLPLADEVVLTRLEACRVARIGLSTFDRAVLAKRLRVQRNGRKISVTREELYRFMGLDAVDA